MENFKPSVKVEGLSKAVKLLTLVIGMIGADNAFSQENAPSMEQLIKDAKKFEILLSEEVRKDGIKGVIYKNAPYSKIHDTSRISQIMYSDNERTEPTDLLVGSKNFYFFDKDFDGKVDAVYVDTNEKPLKIEEGSMKALMSMYDGITQTELDLKVINTTENKFVCIDLNESKIYSTEDKTSHDIDDKDKLHTQETMQKKFNEVLQSNLENINN